MARTAKASSLMDIEVGLYVSEPNARTGKGGGVEYVQLQGPGVDRALMSGGIGPLLEVYGIKVPPSAVYMTANGYGDGRSHVVRVKRVDAEGLKPTPKQAKSGKTLLPWTPARK